MKLRADKLTKLRVIIIEWINSCAKFIEKVRFMSVIAIANDS
jgi:hypothetical protein